ncbi:hypothetical protein L6452_35551 [Arctium lappa]|uniref:Uncharacterized protein n=1 Tax=Arctium lappa TaxID=4217 RepID=A0ACB8Y6T4_ARCLA|nr:hypothetical protein L6452_35551 [Arctium lappa]
MEIEEASIISDFSDKPGFEESSDTSVNMEVPCLPHVVEIVPSGDNMYQCVGHDEQPKIKPVADSKFEVGVSDSSTYPPTTYILDLWSKPESVRNVALVGDFHHGKTVFMDMLVDDAVLIVDVAEGAMHEEVIDMFSVFFFVQETLSRAWALASSLIDLFVDFFVVASVSFVGCCICILISIEFSAASS